MKPRNQAAKALRQSGLFRLRVVRDKTKQLPRKWKHKPAKGNYDG